MEVIQRITQGLAAVRVGISRILYRWVLGPVVGSIPNSTVRSLVELLYDGDVRQHVAEIYTVYDPAISRYDFPESFPECFRRDKAFDKRVAYVLKDVNVSPRSGLAWLGERYILEESVGALRRIVKGWDGVLSEPLRPCKPLSTDKAIVSCPPTGYFHWLLERMPSLLHGLRIVPDAQILLLSKCPQYVLEALEVLLGQKEYENRIVFAEGPVRVSRFVMPQVESYSGFVHEGDIAGLRSAFKAPIGTTKATRTAGLIYISRRGNPKRRVSNENELEGMLRAMRFEVIQCERMSFQEQISLFSGAEFIVALHGAGLANMIWADTPCRILEIFPYAWINDCYARLAVTLGFNYDYVLSGNGPTRNPVVPLKQVSQKIDEILQKGLPAG